MSLKSEPYYWLECDGCGGRAEYGDFSAMATAGAAIDGAMESEWTVLGDKHHCPSCPPLGVCTECGEDIGEDAAGRDGLCQECADEAAPAASAGATA